MKLKGKTNGHRAHRGHKNWKIQDTGLKYEEEEDNWILKPYSVHIQLILNSVSNCEIKHIIYINFLKLLIDDWSMSYDTYSR